MEDYIWKILHVPTGLFYCSRKGRFKDQLTNLSKKGNFYTSEKTADKVLKEDCHRAYINKAQVNAHNLETFPTSFAFNTAFTKDFKIVKYKLISCTD